MKPPTEHEAPPEVAVFMPPLQPQDALPRAWAAAWRELFGARAAPLAAQGEALQPWLCANYGPRGGQGLAWRFGRALARHWWPSLATSAGLHTPTFGLQPRGQRVIEGLRRLARQAAPALQSPVWVDTDATAVYWRWRRCAFGLGCPFNPDHSPPCAPWFGFLQESLYRLSGGRWVTPQPVPGQQAITLPLQW